VAVDIDAAPRTSLMKIRSIIPVLVAILVLIVPAFAQEKSSPPRDSKGRFVKANSKKGQMRDEKGRFVKKETVVKSGPARDPKTGRFVKKTVTTKGGPARDPKTGRFIKSTTAKDKKGPARDPKTGKFIKKN